MVSDSWLLHRNNTPWTQQPLAVTNSIPVFPHLPYPLDLVSCNFLLFPRLKISQKCIRFQDIAATQFNMTQQLQAIPRQAHHRFIKKWKYDWNRCTKPEWSYFGDTWVTWKFFNFPTKSALPVHTLRKESSLNLCTGQPPTGEMIPDAV